MLVENLQRAELPPLQEARAYQRLISRGLSQADAARRLGVSGARIQSRLTILKLPASVQRLFDDGRLPVTLAPLLIRIESPDRQERLANLVALRRLTVPKLKGMVERIVDAERTEAAVDGSRRQPRRKRERQSPSGPSVTYTRADALADLEKRRSCGLHYSDLLRAFDGVCQNCGLERFADTCAACPLPQFIGSLVKEDGNAAL